MTTTRLSQDIPSTAQNQSLVAIAGSIWGGSMLKSRFVGRGMHLEFCHPEYQTPIVTSPIQEIREAQGVQARDRCAGVGRLG